MTERDQLIVDHLPQVRALAKSIYRKLPRTVQFDDVYQAATIGLINAADRFESGKGSKFWSYAKHRVRGEILDYLRGIDYLSRDARRAMKATEVISEANMAPVSLTGEVEEGSLSDVIVDQRKLPDAFAEELERDRILHSAVNCLAERKRRIIKDYYWGGDDMVVIGAALGVKKSWISQLHTASIAQIAAHLASAGITSASI